MAACARTLRRTSLSSAGGWTTTRRPRAAQHPIRASMAREANLSAAASTTPEPCSPRPYRTPPAPPKAESQI